MLFLKKSKKKFKGESETELVVKGLHRSCLFHTAQKRAVGDWARQSVFPKDASPASPDRTQTDRKRALRRLAPHFPHKHTQRILEPERTQQHKFRKERVWGGMASHPIHLRASEKHVFLSPALKDGGTLKA